MVLFQKERMLCFKKQKMCHSCGWHFALPFFFLYSPLHGISIQGGLYKMAHILQTPFSNTLSWKRMWRHALIQISFIQLWNLFLLDLIASSQVMIWCRSGNTPLPGPMMTQFLDAYMGIHVLIAHVLCWNESKTLKPVQPASNFHRNPSGRWCQLAEDQCCHLSVPLTRQSWCGSFRFLACTGYDNTPTPVSQRSRGWNDHPAIYLRFHPNDLNKSVLFCLKRAHWNHNPSLRNFANHKSSQKLSKACGDMGLIKFTQKMIPKCIRIKLTCHIGRVSTILFRYMETYITKSQQWLVLRVH